MSASLVGSEMCIRDSPPAPPSAATLRASTPPPPPPPPPGGSGERSKSASVSYTHLTLPTICSV
eukprot:4073880-Alexandrium_andersonii.AAC.1